MTVIKVGGSLYSMPDLGERLCRFLDTIDDEILLVPGGGGVADAVRAWDRVQGLGEERAHWLAVGAMDLAGMMLDALVGRAEALRSPTGVRDDSMPSLHRVPSGFAKPQPDLQNRFLAVEPFLRQYDTLPHDWSVTSDSIALHAAIIYEARSLILLKSMDVEDDWTRAATLGQVDAYFPILAARSQIPFRVINFRDDS